MSVLLDLSCGELVIDLFVDECPLACENFLKLCKHKFYHNCLLWNVQSNYIVQTGDPTGTGKGGKSAKRLLGISQQETFPDEVTASRLINRTGLVCMANSGAPDTNRSQFFITLSDEHLTHLDGKHTIFGEIAEGFDVLAKINALFCDGDGRPFQDVRILHTHVLDDPFPDPNGLVEPPSPDRKRPETEEVSARIPYEEDLDEGNDVQTQIELEESIKRKAAQSRAIVLEMTGDIPDADIKPPAEVLFVCKLNPVTLDSELELIFSRFGRIKQCDIIRDMKTNDSLGYAFIEFETEESCIEAYNKMNNVLIDDRRIKVDFSQSVSKLWNKFLLKPKQEKQEHVIKKPIKQQVVSAPVATKQPAAHGRSHGDHYGEARGADRRHEGRDSRDGSKQRHRRSRSRSRSRDRHSGHRARSRSPQRKYSDTRDRDRRDEGRRR